MLAMNSLTTLAKARLYCQIKDNAKDEILEFLINSASELIQNDANRIFGQVVDEVEKYAPQNNYYLYLKHTPITNIEEVLIDGIDVTAEIVNKTFYILLPGSAATEISVKYSGGYVLPSDATTQLPQTLPYDLELACCALVNYFLNKIGSEHLVSEQIGPLRTVYINETPEVVKSIVKKYRRINI